MDLIKIRRIVLRLVLNTRMLSDDMPWLEQTPMYSRKVKMHGNLMLKELKKQFGPNQIEALFDQEQGEELCLGYWQSIDCVASFISTLSVEETVELANKINGKSKETILQGFACDMCGEKNPDGQKVEKDGSQQVPVSEVC